SLSATQVIARIRADLGFELPLREIFDAPTIRQLAARLSTAVHTQSPVFRRKRREGPVSLSFAQERLWFLDQLEPGSSAYHIPDAYLVNGPLDVSTLERSLEAVIQRHELLRTTLQSRDGKPVQVVANTANLKIREIDRCGISESEQELEIERQIEENSATVFDLARGPLLQLKVVRLAAERYLLLVNMHHVVSDDWSLGVFYRELSLFYAVFVSGKEAVAELPPLSLQYSDYAICQRQWLESGELSRQLNYWQEQLSGLEPLDLPTDFPRPPRQTFVGTRIPFSLSPELTAGLKAFNRGANATHFMTLLAAFQVLLSKYSRQSDVVVGTPIANRRHVELETLSGFFVNMLVVRGDLTGNPNFRELVRRARRTALDAYQHQDMPFEKLVEAINPDRDLSRPPLFQVMFAIQDVPTHPLTIPGAQVARRVHGVHATHFDLELYLSTQSDVWTGFIGYNTDLFSAGTIERMIGHYQTLLESLLAAPDLPVFTIPMLTRAERGQLAKWNHATEHFAPPDCIHQLFEAQVAKSPKATALEFQDQTLTYQELDLRASQLAAYLQSIGVRRESRVGICVERSLEMVVALLAILKAGGTYIPIDIHFPADRIALILKDAEAQALILHDSLRRLCLGFDGAIVSVDQPVPDVARVDPVEVSGADAAYIYYTSGSTGRPKGVLLEHRSVVNFLRGFQERPGMTDKDVLLALTTISFDPAVLEIFLPLSVGARTVIVPEATRMDPEKLVDLLQQSGATIFQATPTMWQLLLRSEWRRPEVRALIGGEILTPDLAREILSRCGELWNLYGPTETTVWSTAARIERAEDITIGSTIPNQHCYIVDAHDQLVPVGVPGELWIGGAGVGRHYVAQPELSAERFIPDPFGGKNGARVYRTGDLCRYRADGQIEFLGRVDQQIKIRGFRIEPGEIEAALIEHPAIQQCAVVDRTEPAGERRLIAYFVATDCTSVPDPWSLREFLRRKLPDYMLPAAFVTLEKLPLTRSGKVQRSALPAPEPVRRGSANAANIGRNIVERQVAQIWEAILQMDQIGLTDDFFEIGGHSLMAIQLMTEINAAFDIHLPLATIFRAPTIESLTQAIQTSSDIKLKPPGLIISRGHENVQRLFWAPSVGPAERFVECHHLARMLRGEYRFCGFDPAPQLSTIDALAEHCVQLVRSEQPQGPYYLAGYCQGGHVAYEIATRLEREGEEVALLAVIDCSARDMALNLRQQAYWVRDGFRGSASVVLRRIGRFVRRKMFGPNGSAPRPPGPENPFFEHGRAVTTHKARPFSRAVTLFRSDEWLARLPQSPNLGWDALVANLRVYPIHCGHTALMSDSAAVQLIVDIVRKSLEC
ncbi:MAG: amino acid adenylation domain-containing protein, partial [Chthoniobacterales bacterium]